MSITRLLTYLLIAATLFSVSSNVVFAVNKEEQEKKLEEVTEQISQTKQLLNSRKVAKKTLESDLKKTEKDIAENANFAWAHAFGHKGIEECLSDTHTV